MLLDAALEISTNKAYSMERKNVHNILHYEEWGDEERLNYLNNDRPTINLNRDLEREVSICLSILAC